MDYLWLTPTCTHHLKNFLIFFPSDYLWSDSHAQWCRFMLMDCSPSPYSKLRLHWFDVCVCCWGGGVGGARPHLKSEIKMDQHNPPHTVLFISLVEERLINRGLLVRSPPPTEGSVPDASWRLEGSCVSADTEQRSKKQRLKQKSHLIQFHFIYMASARKGQKEERTEK